MASHAIAVKLLNGSKICKRLPVLSHLTLSIKANPRAFA